MNLIENAARDWWRFWSVRLAALAGLVGAYIVAYPDELRKLADLVPEPYRPVAGAVAGFVIFSTATATRLKAQPKLTCPPEDEGAGR